MIFQEYEPLARRTLKELPLLNEHLIHMSMGVTGEFGELIDAQKKVCIYGRDVDQINRTEEVGDICWYIACACKEMQVHPGVIQTSIDSGFIDAKKQDPSKLSQIDVGLNLVALSLAAHGACIGLMESTPGSMRAVEALAALGNIVGVVCSLLGVDPSEALERNVAKLAKRYGDKYSDYMALNRDVEAEREVLISPVQLVPPASPLDLASDSPLSGGSCTTDGPCESCQ